MHDAMDTETLVTIGMPVFNGEETIDQALDSLLAQSHENFELIVSDNASTDNTLEIVDRYAGRDSRIRVIRNTENLGAVANFDKVLDEATGSLFMWAAVDDLWEPDFIKELVHLLETDAEAVLAFCQFDALELSGKYAVKRTNLLPLANTRSRFTRLARFLLMPEPFQKASLVYGLMRTDILRSVGGIAGDSTDKVEWAFDTHTLFGLGLRGGFAISERALFHKRFESRTDWGVPQMTAMSSLREGYQSYRGLISASDLRGYEKITLRVIALINHAINLTGWLIVAACVRLKIDKFTRRFYGRLLH